MIVTNTISADGQCRIYLGGRSSLECWIEPRNDSDLWDFHLEASVTGNLLDQDEQRACAIDLLLQLAKALAVSPLDLSGVPFHRIAALHNVNPFDNRRTPTPKHHSFETGYIATPPGGYPNASKRTRARAEAAYKRRTASY